MKNHTEDKEKMELVSKLVKDGAIDLAEALKLLEVEVEKEYIYISNIIYQQPYTYIPPAPLMLSIPPMYPSLPWYQGGGIQVGDFPYPPSTCDVGTITIPANSGGAITSMSVEVTDVYVNQAAFSYTGGVLGSSKFDNNDSITAQKYKVTCGINMN